MPQSYFSLASAVEASSVPFSIRVYAPQFKPVVRIPRP